MNSQGSWQVCFFHQHRGFTNNVVDQRKILLQTSYRKHQRDSSTWITGFAPLTVNMYASYEINYCQLHKPALCAACIDTCDKAIIVVRYAQGSHDFCFRIARGAHEQHESKTGSVTVLFLVVGTNKKDTRARHIGDMPT